MCSLHRSFALLQRVLARLNQRSFSETLIYVTVCLIFLFRLFCLCLLISVVIINKSTALHEEIGELYAKKCKKGQEKNVFVKKTNSSVNNVITICYLLYIMFKPLSVPKHFSDLPLWGVSLSKAHLLRNTQEAVASSQHE